MNELDPVDLHCTATNRQGKRCGRYPIPGGTVCKFHGGGAPQVKRKAEERLQALIHPAITRLGQLVEQREFPSVAIAAVKDVLDRNMGKAVDRQDVNLSGDLLVSWKSSKA